MSGVLEKNVPAVLNCQGDSGCAAWKNYGSCTGLAVLVFCFIVNPFWFFSWRNKNFRQDYPSRKEETEVCLYFRRVWKSRRPWKKIRKDPGPHGVEERFFQFFLSALLKSTVRIWIDFSVSPPVFFVGSRFFICFLHVASVSSFLFSFTCICLFFLLRMRVYVCAHTPARNT